jgi:hypothetical protein
MEMAGRHLLKPSFTIGHRLPATGSKRVKASTSRTALTHNIWSPYLFGQVPVFKKAPSMSTRFGFTKIYHSMDILFPP